MAINDNINYELSGSQVKDLANRINYKVNRKFFYNTTTTTTVYKKVTISGFTGSGTSPYGVGAFIFTRKQFYVLTGVSGSGANESFYEIGTNENNEEPQDGIGFSAHIKLVYQDGNPPTNILYIALPRYGYCDIHSSGTITIEDSDSTEWEGITADIECKPILANLTKNSGASLGSITAGANTQSYAEVTRLTESTDLNSLTTTGIYIINHTGNTNTPENTTAWGTIICDFTVGTPYQIFIPDGDRTDIWKRKYTKSTSTFGSWTKIVNNGTLTIQKNGTNVQTFSANQSTNATANIEVPTKVSDIENDLNFIEDDTTQVCDEDSDIELEGTTKAPLEIKKLEGKTFQQNYEGKNLLQITHIAAQTKDGITITFDGSSFVLDGTATASIDLYIHGASWGDTTKFVALPAGIYTLSVRKADMSLGANFAAKMYNNSGSGQRIFDFNANPSGVATTTLDADSGFTNFYITINSGVTFNNERFYVQLEESSSASDYEPYVGGKASPSPDYPQVIDVVTGRNIVSIAKDSVINQECSYVQGYFDAHGVVVESSTSISGNEYFEVLPSTKYDIISDVIKAGTSVRRIAYYDSNKGFISRSNEVTETKTFTTPSNAVYIRYYLYNENGITATDDVKTYIDNIRIFIDPYQSYEINLGKNLFNKEDAVVGALLSDGTIDSTNYAHCRTSDYIYVKPNSTYTISGRTSWNVYGEYTKDKTFISRPTANTFTTGPETYYVRVVCVNSDLNAVQVEAGSVASSYSDYFTPIELCRIATAYDYIYRSGNNFYIHREIGKYIFDGSETWSVNGNNWRTTNPITDLKSSEISDMGLSDKFIYWANTSGSVGTGLPEGYFGFPQNKQNIDFRYSGVSTAADFKTWVENNTIIIYYVKETPEEELITNDELIFQLRDLWNATGYDDKTEVISLSYGSNSRIILSVCQYPNHIPVASQYKVGSVTVGDGLLVDDGGRISLDMSYIGTSITKISNSEIDTIMGVQ